MLKFITYSRKSKNAQDGHTQHTHATAEWHINNYLKQLDAQGIAYEVIASYEENISGGGYYTKRPIFSSIVDMCKKDKSLTLLVSKADRMARNVRTGAELMETINFVLANAPDADDLQKQLEFMIAEREWKSTSDRFKDMYQAKKARCEKTGETLIWGANSPKYNKTNHVSKSSHRERVVKLEEVKEPFTKVITLMKEKKLSDNKMTLAKIANNLNMLNVKCPTGNKWNSNNTNRAMSHFKIERV